MDNSPTLSLLPFPTVVSKNWKAFEQRYKQILNQNVTRMILSFQYESEAVREYEELKMIELTSLRAEQRQRSRCSTTMTNANSSILMN